MIKNTSSAFKSFLFCCVILFTQSRFGHAQSAVQVGPYLGMGVRMLTGNDTPDFGFGHRIGLITRIPLSEEFAVAPSVTYARKGYIKYKFDVMFPDGITNEKLNYLDFIIPAKYTIGKMVTLQAGLQVGVLMSANLIYDRHGSDRFRTSIKEELNPVDMGFVYGVGLQIDNGFGVEFVINQGFSSIYKDDVTYYLDDDFTLIGDPEMDGKNFFAAINVYYLIGYKKIERE